MTGDKFRVRADRYIKAARAVTDPVHKLALVDVAQRWLRLAAQIDGAAIDASRNSEGPATQVRSALARPTAESASPDLLQGSAVRTTSTSVSR
jgi:hypothetical protein